MPPADLPFAIERWSADASNVVDVLATAGNQQVAAAAFREAVRLYPNAVILLRNRAPIVDKSNWPG